MRAPFSFTVPTRVRFGSGVSRDIVSVLPKGTKHVALVRGGRSQTAAPIRAVLETAGIACVEVPCPGEPTVPGVNDAVSALKAADIQAIVAVGGGSVIDMGKAVTVCLAHGLSLGHDFSEVPTTRLAQPAPLPCVAVPTTAGTGAEVTANTVLQIPALQAKVSLRGRALFPSDALVDPDLLKSARPSVLLSSGLDAVVQTLEAYVSTAATPFSDAMTEPNISRGLTALKSIMGDDPPDSAWQDMAWTSLCSGIALANGGLGAAHGIASVIGGRYRAPHGAICGRLIVPVLRMNRALGQSQGPFAERLSACATLISDIYPPVKTGDDFSGLEAWMDQSLLPRLRAFGVRPGDIPSIAEAACAASSSKKNRFELKPADFEEILERAF